MKKIYCIPGLGVDERLFGEMRVKDANLVFIKWIVPLKNESLGNYAQRLSEQIDQREPFYLVGVSFGGMCALEIAKRLNPVKTILISSAKGQADIPWYFKILRFLPVHRLMSDKMAVRMAVRNAGMFGISSSGQKELFRDMLLKAPKGYYSRALNCIVQWRNRQLPANLVHLHGTRDRIIPARFVKDFIPVNGGSHFMVMNSAGEVNELIETFLR